MRVLVTRPDPDGATLCKRLRAAGRDAVLAPLLEIVDEDGVTLDPRPYRAILLTSANGVRALARLTAVRDLPLFCVGDATARTARALGFDRVETAGGDVTALADLVRDRLTPGDAPLLHVAGSVVAGDLKGDLEREGFRVERLVAYHARTVQALPSAATDALMRGGIDAALFYSPRTARTFVTLAEKAGVRDALGAVTAGCLSPAVRDALQSLPWRRIVVGDAPTEVALLAALGLELYDETN